MCIAHARVTFQGITNSERLPDKGIDRELPELDRRNDELLKMLRKIISGGQTGADRAELDFAIETGLEHGDTFPRAEKQRMG